MGTASTSRTVQQRKSGLRPIGRRLWTYELVGHCSAHAAWRNPSCDDLHASQLRPDGVVAAHPGAVQARRMTCRRGVKTAMMGNLPPRTLGSLGRGVSRDFQSRGGTPASARKRPIRGSSILTAEQAALARHDLLPVFCRALLGHTSLNCGRTLSISKGKWRPVQVYWARNRGISLA